MMPLEPLATTDSHAVSKFKIAISKLEIVEGRQAALDFVPDSSDVIIATPPKCGTTLVQQICHSLRSNGDMSFDEISLVIPCLEMAWSYGYMDLAAPQPFAPPQLYKTHFWRRHCPRDATRGNRVIYVCRDPRDAGPSFYSFMNGWMFPRDSIPMDDFLEQFWLARGEAPTGMQNAGHFHNMASWYPCRAEPWMLWLHYEDLIENLERCVDLIAEFLGGQCAERERRRVAVQQAGIEVMKSNKGKYDEHMLKRARNEECGLPRHAGMTEDAVGKVHGGGIHRVKVSDALGDAIKNRWLEVMQPVTGFDSYSEMRSSINTELGRPWV